MSNKVYEIITDRILGSLDKGVIPWIRPWDSVAPYNAVSKKAYKGINALLLAYADGGPGFMTINQANSLGGKVKKGTKAEPITFWKMLKRTNKDGEEETIPLLRYFNVFGVNNIEGLPDKFYSFGKKEYNEVSVFDEAERIVGELQPKLSFGGDRACYNPALDVIRMPERNKFSGSEEYYNTLFHELAHWTGHETRLKRPLAGMGSESYAPEELIAEIGAACVCASIGLDYSKTITNTVAYCQSWAKGIRGDKNNTLISCASKGHKAADFIMGLVPEEVTADV